MRVIAITVFYLICTAGKSQTGLNDLSYSTIHCYDKNAVIQDSIKKAHSKGQIFISGKMVDLKTKEPLPYGSVWVNNTKTEATTDINGNYTVSVPDTLKKVNLWGSYINYEPKKVLINLSNKKELVQDFVLVSRPGVECPGVDVRQTKKQKK